MKVLISTLILMLLMLAASLKAQTIDNPGTPEQRAQKITQEMHQTFPLDSSQLVTVHALNLKYAKKAQREIIDPGMSTWGMLIAGQKLNQEKEEELKLLLSEAQWDKYLEMRASRMKEIMKQLFD